MIRSNSKKALENIRSYIVNNTDFTGYNVEIPENYTFKNIAPVLMHIFYEEKIKWNKRMVNYQNEFIDWLQGLPSAIDSCYYYNRSAVKDLGDILEKTEEERNKYTEADAERMLSCLIWRELYKACHYEVK